ncbi:MAG: zinc ribbon domain-containing protein [Armatimonadetes bacterium]|nr:zinc ribbon domain-containing protein [Armatimonadota bacterium]
MAHVWRRIAVVATATALVAGCGGGGSTTPTDVTGTLIAQTRAVPETVSVASSPTVRVVGGDDYLLILSESAGSTGNASVTVNGGGTNLALLDARRSTGPRRHTPTASWGLGGLGQTRAENRAEPDPAVGSSRTFSVVEGSQPTVTATLKAKGTHCLLYVDDSTVAGAFTDANLLDMRDTFDNQIYSTNTGIYGATGDVDSNGRIILLFTPTIRAGGYGYFYPSDVLGAGNNADMLYARVPSPSNGQTFAVLRTGLLATMAHELAHLINFHYKRADGGEESWLNEGLSFACEQLNGWLDSAGGSPENVAAYFRSPERYTLHELTGNYDDGHAGAGFLFVRYLEDRFGQNIIGRLVTSSEVGQANVTAAAGVAYTTLMTDAAAAWYLAGTGLTTDTRWSLPGFDTHGTYPVESVSLSGPKATRVSAANSRPAFTASFARGGLRYVRLTNVPAAGAMFALTTSSGAQVRATFVRIPTAAGSCAVNGEPGRSVVGLVWGLGTKAPNRQVSPERKKLYRAGQVLCVVGVLLFMLGGGRGIFLVMIGMGLMAVGAQGLAGSGLVLDPEQARADLEPWSRMTGGMVNDALSEVELVQKPAEPQVTVRCQQCHALNDEDAKFCKQCGQPL